jgi:hypothetical protein
MSIRRPGLPIFSRVFKTTRQSAFAELLPWNRRDAKASLAA